jgi:hypothetical protein
MGAWGAESFANDDAMDWVAEFENAGFTVVESAVRNVLDSPDGYPESPVCAEGLAAAEVVAASLGRPCQDLPAEVQDWLTRTRTIVDLELLSKTREAVASIVARSELRELWHESDDAQLWYGSVTDLQARLS